MAKPPTRPAVEILTVAAPDLHAIDLALSALYRLESIERALSKVGETDQQRDQIEHYINSDDGIMECRHALRQFVRPIVTAYEDAKRVAFINHHSTCRVVPLPSGWRRKRSGTIVRGDRYYNEAESGWTTCENAHTFLGVDAKHIKVVIEREPAC